MKIMTLSSRKHILVTTAAMAAAAILVMAGVARSEPVKAADSAPGFTAYTATGKKVSLSDFRGQTVFLSFWGSWCATNRDEMDYFRSLKSRHPDLVFLAINSDTARADMRSMAGFATALSQWQVPMDVIFDRDFAIRDMYGVNTLPTGIIINDDGLVAFITNNFYSSTPKGFEMMLGDNKVSSLK